MPFFLANTLTEKKKKKRTSAVYLKEVSNCLVSADEQPTGERVMFSRDAAPQTVNKC